MGWDQLSHYVWLPSSRCSNYGWLHLLLVASICDKIVICKWESEHSARASRKCLQVTNHHGKEMCPFVILRKEEQGVISSGFFMENSGELDGWQSQRGSCCAGRELWLLAVLPSDAAFCQRWESCPPTQALAHRHFFSICIFIHNLPNSAFAWT